MTANVMGDSKSTWSLNWLSWLFTTQGSTAMTKEYTQHPLGKMFRPLTDIEYTGLREHISEWGQKVKIILLDGKILDGWHRYLSCRELDIEPEFTTFQGTEQDAVDTVIGMNLHRRHSSDSDKRAIVSELLKIYPHLSNRAIGRMAQTGHPLVGELREELEANEVLEFATSTVGADGKNRPRKRRTSPERQMEIASNKSSAQSVKDAIPNYRKPRDIWEKTVNGWCGNKQHALDAIKQVTAIGEAEVAVDRRMNKKAVDEEQP